MQYKLVCWDDFSIPVPVDHDWLAFDQDGECYSYKSKPEKSGSSWGCFFEVNDLHLLTTRIIITPPEQGSWDTQLYWIGD